MTKESDKIINSLFKTVLSHLNDGIRNVLENSEITREITHNEATGSDNYSFRINFGGKSVLSAEIEDTTSEFAIKDGILTAYRGQEKEVTLPDSVKEIGPNAFLGKLIQSIEIPDSVTTIGDSAFQDCFMLERIRFGTGLTTIGSSAFEGCSELVEANLPNTVEIIGKRAFAEAWSLESIHLPENLEAIPDELFKGCRSLEQIEWPNHATRFGKDIFEDCFDPDIWGYFSIQNGICRRETADRELLDPDGLFSLNIAYYAQSQANKLLNWIWRNAAYNSAQIDEYMQIARFAMKVTAIITDCDIYAAMLTASICHEYLKANAESSISSKDYEAMLRKILETVCGNGESLRRSDMHIRDTILENEDPNDTMIQEIADKCFLSLIEELNIRLSPNRYHPSIFHYGADYREGDSYWQFVIKLEGLLRYNGYNITQCEVFCDSEDGLDDWLCTWSKAIESTDLTITRLEFTDESGASTNWLLLLDNHCTGILHDMLEESGCSTCMTGWLYGKKLFALTII